MRWAWEHEGKCKTREDPRLFADRKCKRITSLFVDRRGGGGRVVVAPPENLTALGVECPVFHALEGSP